MADSRMQDGSWGLRLGQVAGTLGSRCALTSGGQFGSMMVVFVGTPLGLVMSGQLPKQDPVASSLPDSAVTMHPDAPKAAATATSTVCKF